MKLIDRYFLRGLLAPLIICIAAFVMLFIIKDLFDHLDDFVKASTPFQNIAQYYLFLIPSIFYLLVPLALLLAVLYCLSSMTKNNELTAMRASGVSLYRLLVPIIATGLIFVALVYVINEKIAPHCAYWCDQFIHQEKHGNRDKEKGEVNVHLIHTLPLKNDVDRRIWGVGEFNSLTYKMKNVVLIQERKDGSFETEYNAETADWLDGKWWFHNVTIQEYDDYSNPRGAVEQVAHLEMSHLTERPKNFLSEIKYKKEYLSAQELSEFLGTRPNASERLLAIYQTDFHYRMAAPWTCLVVALLGIPLGGATGRRGAFFGVFLSLAFFFSYYVAIMFCLNLGKQGSLSPWIAGWLPSLAFGLLGLTCLYRMR